MAETPHKYLDAYTVRARFAPALLVMFPIGLAIIAWFPAQFIGWGLLVGAAFWSGSTLLLAELGRDLGKQKQPTLYGLWGGAPTTQLLRHRDQQLDVHTKK